MLFDIEVVGYRGEMAIKIWSRDRIEAIDRRGATIAAVGLMRHDLAKRKEPFDYDRIEVKIKELK